KTAQPESMGVYDEQGSDGPHVARSAGKHRREDRILAGGVRRSLLRPEGRGPRRRSGFTQGWTAAARSKERRPQVGNRSHAPVQERPRGQGGPGEHGEAVGPVARRVRRCLLPWWPRPPVGP